MHGSITYYSLDTLDRVVNVHYSALEREAV
jgi:hypothetical protein